MAEDGDALRRELSAQGFRCIETHISRVYLRGAEVFKTKRAVDMGFLDFCTLAQRRDACVAELSLNRRLADDVYIQLCALVRDSGGRLAFVPEAHAAPEPVLEFAVHMRRLPDEARADLLLERGELSPAEMAALGRFIADFHEGARNDGETAGFGTPEVIAANIEENFAQVHAHVRDHLSQEENASIERSQRAFLAEHEALFAARAAGGFVRDGHGDLRLEHVYRSKSGGHVIIDCIEFNERFRFADVCADLAFLSMDLRAHGRADLADLLVAAYAEASEDYGLYGLLDFYEGYRAFVRGKVASFLAHDQQVRQETRMAAEQSARRHFLLALAAARPAMVRPRLIVCMGLIASGKSSVAEALGERLGAGVLCADRVRKRLLGLPLRASRPDATFSGGYAPEVTAEVYARLRARARAVLDSGRSVIVDATFRERSERQLLRELARSVGVEVLFLDCRCSRATAMERLGQRARSAHVSDGRAEIYDAFTASFEPADELPPGQHVVLDTERPLAHTLQALAKVL